MANEQGHADEQGVPSDGTTLVAVLQGYASAGWSGDFLVTPDAGIRCTTCGAKSPGESVAYESLRRLEGASDPGDELVVAAITCPNCGTRGPIVLRYAADAAPEEVTLFRHLTDRRHRGDLPPDGPPTEGPGVAGPDADHRRGPSARRP
jgi:DNA-directed RNA polymerase subunit RPC12/RpoP